MRMRRPSVTQPLLHLLDRQVTPVEAGDGPRGRGDGISHARHAPGRRGPAPPGRGSRRRAGAGRRGRRGGVEPGLGRVEQLAVGERARGRTRGRSPRPSRATRAPRRCRAARGSARRTGAAASAGVPGRVKPRATASTTALGSPLPSTAAAHASSLASAVGRAARARAARSRPVAVSSRARSASISPASAAPAADERGEQGPAHLEVDGEALEHLGAVEQRPQRGAVSSPAVVSAAAGADELQLGVAAGLGATGRAPRAGRGWPRGSASRCSGAV